MGKLKEPSKRFWEICDRILQGWSIILMGTMATLVVIAVIMRYVLNLTYVWSEELIIYLFIATTYFGSILCVKEIEHIDIPFLRDMAPRAVQHVMDVIVELVNIAIQVSLAYFSFTWIEKTGSSVTSGLFMPLYIVYIIFPVSFMLMAIYTLRRIEKDTLVNIKASIKSQAGWIITNIVFFILYAGTLAGLAYAFFSIGGIERINISLHPAMTTQIYIFFCIMFALYAIVAVKFAINRIICMFKKDSLTEVGGEQ